jgi:hypothetical protein
VRAVINSDYCKVCDDAMIDSREAEKNSNEAHAHRDTHKRATQSGKGNRAQIDKRQQQQVSFVSLKASVMVLENGAKKNSSVDGTRNNREVSCSVKAARQQAVGGIQSII